jgi:hypothetical protein
MADQKSPTTGVELDISKIERFTLKGGSPAAGSCYMGDGNSYPEGWEWCLNHTVFKCDGTSWVNTGRSC